MTEDTRRQIPRLKIRTRKLDFWGNYALCSDIKFPEYHYDKTLLALDEKENNNM